MKLFYNHTLKHCILFIVQNEENISVNDIDNPVDHNVIVKQLPSESRRKSKR